MRTPHPTLYPDLASYVAAARAETDEIPVERVKAWELGFQRDLQTRHGELLKKIREEKVLSEEVEKSLVSAIESFNEDSGGFIGNSCPGSI